jgi:hypothetical protein
VSVSKKPDKQTTEGFDLRSAYMALIEGHVQTKLAIARHELKGERNNARQPTTIQTPNRTK